MKKYAESKGFFDFKSKKGQKKMIRKNTPFCFPTC